MSQNEIQPYGVRINLLLPESLPSTVYKEDLSESDILRFYSILKNADNYIGRYLGLLDTTSEELVKAKNESIQNYIEVIKGIAFENAMQTPIWKEYFLKIRPYIFSEQEQASLTHVEILDIGEGYEPWGLEFTVFSNKGWAEASKNLEAVDYAVRLALSSIVGANSLSIQAPDGTVEPFCRVRTINDVANKNGIDTFWMLGYTFAWDLPFTINLENDEVEAVHSHACSS